MSAAPWPTRLGRFARTRRVALGLLALVLVAACGGPRTPGLAVSPSTPAPLAEVLTRMPAPDERREGELAQRLYEQGPTTLTHLVAMLGTASADDDAAAAYAIEAVTRWAARPRRDDTRAGWATMLTDELAQVGAIGKRRFLLAQLERVAGDAEVPALAPLLDDAELGDDAARVMVAIDSPAAAGAVTDALERAGETPPVWLLTAAGALRAEAAAPALHAALWSSDHSVVSAAAHALAELALPGVDDELLGALSRTEWADRHDIAAATLRHAVAQPDVDEGLIVTRALLGFGVDTGDEALVVSSMRTMAILSEDLALAALADLDPELARTSRELGRLGADLEARRAVREAAAAEAEEGFVSLFNGEDLTGWVGATDGYFVQDGAIVCDPETGGNLYTESEYADFVLRFEFRLTPGANNGLGIRAPLEGDAAYVGMELQVLDDNALRYADLRPYQYHGSIYGVAAVERGHQRPVGEWNEQEVIAHGRRVRVVLNGAVVLDVDLDEVSTPETVDGRDHPGLARTAGHIGFLGHGSRVEYRNIRLREIR